MAHSTDASTPDSLIQTLIDLSDTDFKGKPIEKARDFEVQTHESIEDSQGNTFTQPHDHLETITRNGEAVGIFVADEDGRHVHDHEKSDIPHGIGLFVRDSYRGEGIGTELVNNFMRTIEEDTLVIHCESSVVPFYYQLDHQIAYLKNIQNRIDPFTPPIPADAEVLSIDTSNSPKHNIPFVSAEVSDGEFSWKDQDVETHPRMVIRQHKNFGQLCRLTIEMPYPESIGGDYDYLTLTDEAIDELNSVLDEIIGHRLRKSAGDTDILSFKMLEPDLAREIADKVYPIVTNRDNLEL